MEWFTIMIQRLDRLLALSVFRFTVSLFHVLSGRLPLGALAVFVQSC